MHPNFARCYDVLGVHPDEGWQRLRAAYRRHVRRWHPDRFPEHGDARRQAEERTKAINEAYRELSTYYEHHGELPPLPAETRRRATVAPPPPTPAASAPIDTPAPTRAEAPPRAALRTRIAASIAAVVAAWALVNLFVSLQPETGPAAAAPGNDAETDAVPPNFTIGSTIGDVYTLQGVPTRTEAGVWHYGESQVHFANGRVTRWIEHPSSPLNVLRDQAIVSGNGTTSFSLGSSPDDVRRAQGAPVLATDRVWDYGASKVYFEHGRVSGWHDSPLAPLNIAR